MSCTPCAVVRQVVMNLLLAADRCLNAALLGNPNETLSQRTARASNAGSKVASTFCAILGFFSKDHCAWSLTPGTVGAEIWHWSPDTPVTGETVAE